MAFGLPDWVFTGALVLMALGLRRSRFHSVRASHVARAQRARDLAPRLPRGAIAVGAFAIAVVAIMVLARASALVRRRRCSPRESCTGASGCSSIDFNAGKDSSLSHVVTEAVRTNLGQSKVVSIMPPTAIAAALAAHAAPASIAVDLALAREIAQREGVKAIVAGDVTPLGTGYVVSIRLVSADSGASSPLIEKRWTARASCSTRSTISRASCAAASANRSSRCAMRPRSIR